MPDNGLETWDGVARLAHPGPHATLSPGGILPLMGAAPITGMNGSMWAASKASPVVLNGSLLRAAVTTQAERT